MNKTQYSVLVLVGIFNLVNSGCELTTTNPPPPVLHPANHFVINEVFTLPLTHPTYYSWIEFYNASPDPITLTNWTLTMHARRYTAQALAVYAVDSSQVVPVGTDSIYVRSGGVSFSVRKVSEVLDSVGILDIPFGEGQFFVRDSFNVRNYDPRGADSIKIVADVFSRNETSVLPGKLLTLVNNEDRLLDHSIWGSLNNGDHRQAQFFEGAVYDRNVVLHIVNATAQLDTVFILYTYKRYEFVMVPDEQLVLKDPSGRIMDVVRIGNYTAYQPVPFSDSLGLLGSQNRPVGVPDPYQSVCRFADAYFTGNTASDFRRTTSMAPPSPGSYNPQP